MSVVSNECGMGYECYNWTQVRVEVLLQWFAVVASFDKAAHNGCRPGIRPLHPGTYNDNSVALSMNPHAHLALMTVGLAILEGIFWRE